MFDPDGAGGANGTTNVGSFGFETGNALAQGSIPLTVGSTFQLYFQTRLTNFTVAGGGTVVPAGLNGSAGGPAFEITAIASITEVVTGVTGNGGAATFATAPVQAAGSFFRMFYHTGQISDNFTGAGFGTGTLIVDAVPDASLGSSGNFSVSTDANGNPSAVGPFDTFDAPGSAPGLAYAGITSVAGSGSSRIGFRVTSFDPSFFQTAPLSLFVNAFNNVPFSDTTPSQFFNDATNTPIVPALRGTVNGVSGPDFQFMSRASASFTAVPEPASMALTGLGLVGALGLFRRRRAVTA